LVDLREIKRRTTETANLARKISITKNKHWEGWIGDVLIDEIGKKPSSWMGRNFAYKPVVIKSSDNLLGKTMKTKIITTFPTYLLAKIC
ncbi:TRAM domain-containing protein, partial [Candidatus Bathyarchaeota archaeon]|nr:TRAM domain-containing protein [Candidatus Bathyarchaeota archaeon]